MSWPYFTGPLNHESAEASNPPTFSAQRLLIKKCLNLTMYQTIKVHFIQRSFISLPDKNVPQTSYVKVSDALWKISGIAHLVSRSLCARSLWSILDPHRHHLSFLPSTQSYDKNKGNTRPTHNATKEAKSHLFLFQKGGNMNLEVSLHFCTFVIWSRVYIVLMRNRLSCMTWHSHY